MRKFWKRDQVVFLTHTPTERCDPGRTWIDPYEKRAYRITRIRQTSNTRLFNGGSAPCWEVRGYPLPDEEHG